MSKRIGSIYQVEVDDDRVRYFWDVGTDHTQLGSALIVVFQRSYSKLATPDFAQIVADEVDFYCHAMLLGGKKLGLWSKVGFRRVDRSFAMLFRDSSDYGNPQVRVTTNWWIWEPNQPQRKVGVLTGDFSKAEVGVVFAPHGIVNRIRQVCMVYFTPHMKMAASHTSEVVCWPTRLMGTFGRQGDRVGTREMRWTGREET